MHLPTSTSPALPPPTTRLPSTGGAATTHTLHSIYQWRDKKTRCSDEEVTPASNGNRKITHECATNWQPWAVNNQERLLRRFVGRRHLSVFCTIKIKRSVVERTVFPPDLQKLHFELRDGTFQSRSSALTMIRPTTAAESQCVCSCSASLRRTTTSSKSTSASPPPVSQGLWTALPSSPLGFDCDACLQDPADREVPLLASLCVGANGVRAAFVDA